MHVVNLRMSEVRKLRKLILEDGILNTEALMLVLKRRSFPDKMERVFKYLDRQDDSNIMAKKLFTVTSLNTENDYQKIDELVIPDSIIYVDGKIAGFGIPLIYEHKNLGLIINDENVSLDRKLSYLVQMGNIIDKVERVDNTSYRFQFGDLNEFNFILDKNDKVKAIDLDSTYLGYGEPFDMAYYLLKNKYIKSLPEKYKLCDNGVVIPTDNTDLYCYNMIILNALSKMNIYKCNIEIYYEYLDYIKSLNLPDLLIESLNNIYIPKDNINPKDVLNDIDPELEEELEFKTFIKKYKK